MDTILLMGVVCFFSCTDGKVGDKPLQIGNEYPTVEKCQEVANKINEKLSDKTIEWVGGRVTCVKKMVPDV